MDYMLLAYMDGLSKQIAELKKLVEGLKGLVGERLPSDARDCPECKTPKSWVRTTLAETGQSLWHCTNCDAGAIGK